MKMKALTLAAVSGSFIMTGAASADLIGVSWEIFSAGAPAGDTTYRFFADFDNAADQLLAVSGNQNVGGFYFQTSSVIVNSSLYALGALEDLYQPMPFSDPWDSWVTIGYPLGGQPANNTQLSPGFLGGDGTAAVIQGSVLSQANNGGWFDSNPATPANGGHVLIAQFTVAANGDGSAGQIHMEGTIDYNPGGGPPSSSEFFTVDTPAPGALALLGLAGLVGTRRRRA